MMTDSTRTPHLLHAYLRLPPEASLLLLSNVLNATSNWLLLRYLLLAGKAPTLSIGPSPGVVFVSFLRDQDFWRDGCRRLGFDVNRAQRTGRVVYVDGFSKLFSGKHQSALTSGGSQDIILTDSHLSSIEASICKALTSMSDSSGIKPLLVVDGLDFLLAATHISAAELLDSLMIWREMAHSTILSLSSDGPLIHTRQTPLEIQHAALVTSLVHQAYLVLSLRLLSTGVARDVSGVLRASRGGAVEQIDGTASVDEREILYLVSGDGDVKAFERGSA